MSRVTANERAGCEGLEEEGVAQCEVDGTHLLDVRPFAGEEGCCCCCS